MAYPYLDLCSGIGGFALTTHPHFYPIAFCEKEAYPVSILRQWFPTTPIYEDVYKLDGKLFTHVPLLTAGFPCQPYSIAGHRGGNTDHRYLWPEVLRVVIESKPTWVVIENVTEFIKLELDMVLLDLEANGFECQGYTIPACAKGARHNRDRLWLVAYSDENRLQGLRAKQVFNQPLQSSHPTPRNASNWIRESVLFEPKLCRSLTEFPHGVDRIKAVGESIAPDACREIFNLIAMSGTITCHS